MLIFPHLCNLHLEDCVLNWPLEGKHRLNLQVCSQRKVSVRKIGCRKGNKLIIGNIYSQSHNVQRWIVIGGASTQYAPQHNLLGLL